MSIYFLQINPNLTLFKYIKTKFFCQKLLYGYFETLFGNILKSLPYMKIINLLLLFQATITFADLSPPVLLENTWIRFGYSLYILGIHNVSKHLINKKAFLFLSRTSKIIIRNYNNIST